MKLWITDEKANVAAALFEREDYTGTLTSDLFASGSKIKKGNLVDAMVKAFAEAKSGDDVDARYEQAKGWLPEAMGFPATDPDTHQDRTEEYAA